MGFVWIAVLLGIVEGLTEFIPVSSTGHLIIAGRLLGFGGEAATTFEIVIQLGAILAVVVQERHRFLDLLRPRQRGGFAGPRGCVLLGVTTLPVLVVGLLLGDFIKRHLWGPAPVAGAFLAGGIGILLAERFRPAPRTASVDGITWRQAVLIGLFQCLAVLWPGISRSAATIVGGLFGGLGRQAAAEYSFLAAVPALTAAAGYDLLKSWSLLQGADALPFAVGFVVAFLTAWLTVRAFISLLGRFSLRPYAWYRIGIAPLVYWLVK
jgi:undecaprenyl-diphosphatase